MTRPSRALSLLLAALVLPGIAAAQSAEPPVLPRTHAPEPTTADITSRDLMTRLYIIADDSMEGREAGTRGGRKVEEYLAREARRMGLEPAGDNGTYFQSIPLVVRGPDSTATLRAGDQVLHAGSDFVLLSRIGLQIFLGGQPYGGTFSGQHVPSVFGGQVGGAMIDTAAARGKVVVFLAPPGPNGAPLFQFWRRDNLAQFAGAAAVMVVTLDAGAPAAFTQPRETYADSTRPWPVQLTVLSVTTAAATAVLGAAPSTLTPGAAGRAVSGTVRFADRPSDIPARNVAAILRGRDARLRGEYIGVSAHMDHVGMINRPLDHDSIRVFNRIARPRGADDPQPRPDAATVARIAAALDSVRREHPARPDSIFNGADDDGSGTVLTLEVAEHFASLRGNDRPLRSILFVWHTAEEKGLFGAQYFAEHPSVPLDSVMALVNMDQMGRGQPSDNPPAGPGALELIGPGRRSSELGAIVDRVNAAQPRPFVLSRAFDRPGEPTQAWCRSDHFEYARFGVPVAFLVAAAWHIDYHMVSDEPQYIDYERLTSIGRYVRSLATTLANLDHRLTLDQPAPDPGAMCRQ